MSNRTRRLTILILVLLFIVAAGTILPYSQGWRLNFQTLKWQKVGGLYVRSHPQNALIFLDHKPTRNKTGFLDRGTLVSGIAPGTYELRLTAPGFQSWQKQITIEPEQVAETKYAVLTPALESALTVPSLPPAKDFWLIDGQILVSTLTDTLAYANGSLPGSDLVTLSGSRTATVLVRTPSSTILAYDLGRGTTTATITPNAKNQLESALAIIPDPDDPESLFVIQSRAISYLDLTTGVTTTLATYPKTSSVGSLWPSRAFTAWTVQNSATTATSTLVLWNRIDRTLSTIPIPDKITKAQWIANDTVLLQTTHNTLALYKTSEDQPRTLLENAEKFAVAPDGTSIAVLGSNRLEIFSLTDNGTYFRTPFPNTKEILALEWYKDGRHLFLSYADHVDFLEIGDTARENLQTLVTGGKTEYDSRENRLYFLSGGKVKYLEFPTD